MSPSAAPVASGAVPAAPPAQVFAEMSVAARACDRLAATGHRLCFAASTGRRVTVTFADVAGNPLVEVSPSAALRVAAGGALY